MSGDRHRRNSVQLLGNLFCGRSLQQGYLCDRMAVINEGRIIAIGTPEEVKRKDDPLIQQFLHADIKRTNES